MSYTTTVGEEVVDIDDTFFREVAKLSRKHPGVIQSWNEAVQMATALRTLDLFKKKSGKK
jgi:hypothetical protein